MTQSRFSGGDFFSFLLSQVSNAYPLSLTPSFGFVDRFGIATSGYIAAVRGTGFVPVFA